MKDRKLSHKLMKIIFNTPSLLNRLMDIGLGSTDRKIVIDGVTYVVKFSRDTEEEREDEV